MNKTLLAVAALITTVASTSIHIGNCNESLSFAEEHTPGTKFTCTNYQTCKLWDCKVIEVMFPICNKEEDCKSFNCQYRGGKDNTLGGCQFIGSMINITVDESKWLLEQIKVPNLKLKPVLLFRATRDGWLVTDYHSKVDGHTNFYIFIKFKESQRRSAGFTQIDQGIINNLANDNQSFILSIDKRIVATGNQNNRNLNVYPDYGPMFTYGQGFIVLSVQNDDYIDYGFAICGRSEYYMPLEDNQLCSLTGLQKNRDHEIDELEVWHIL
ncbi:hypothetical protein FGO68_gene16098 [Halteria grandinella]|uniref:TLDc domain-containing protein n=1 Tax=Halteria grandinella TaxID=5974 RepID=A0A8J8SZM6_HALGN|nr:hypothetical protein FGO68_gene16098 [Halteria grandinella]